MAVNPAATIRTYHMRNRKMRLMRNFESSSRDPNALVVYNYGIIAQLYKYPRSFYSEYYKWWNTEAAVWKNIDDLVSKSDRQNFIMCKLPVILPSLPDLRLGSMGMTQHACKIFHSHESLMILEIWKWLGSSRKDSVISNLNSDHLNKVNIIYQESNRWFVMNLGILNSWRMATENELEENPEANVKGLEPAQLQRRYLRMMMSLFQARSVAAAEVTNHVNDVKVVAEIANTSDSIKGNTNGETSIQTNSVTPSVTVQIVGTPVINKVTGVVETPTKETKLTDEDTYVDEHNARPTDRGEDIKHDPLFDEKLIAELAELEHISLSYNGPPTEDVETSKVKEYVVVDVPIKPMLEDGVNKVCKKLADSGFLSAAELRRYNQLAVSYKNILSPDKKTTLEHFIKVPPEAVVIKESHAIPDIKTVTDKSMLKSSLHTFYKDYITNVMQKDVAAMVMNIQNAGIAVTAYDVEEVEDVMGSYYNYTVRVTPVEGASSTLKFKLPKLNEDGTYEANGTKYRLRLQRSDNPIRKIAPDRVALTSYYNKIFISRSDKRVNDYGKWLCNSIMERGIESADQSITNLHPGDVFDNLFVAPKLFTTVAMNFRGFSIKSLQSDGYQFDLNFDHTKREEIYTKAILDKYEADGSVVLGIGEQDIAKYLVVDKNDNLYYTDGVKDLVPYHPFESLLGLDSEKAPVEFAELRIPGRTIPVCILLGYELGLDKLMALLDVVPRRVPAGQRLHLTSDEYSVVFSDETLVFPKENKKASMILAGFNEYHRAIRQFSVYEFDRRGVYLNVLESTGYSVRVLRELDLLYQLFIDPITLELLETMKQPTTFHGLVMRSCELLLNDQHMDEFDRQAQRFKGYERMAGAVYSELVKVIRAHSGRAGRSKFPIDLNPFAVWKNISQDPSVTLVSDINPIENIKEAEAVTYNGVGGRNSRSMTKHTRSYHRNDMGTISEATVDSSDVAINTYTSADPQFNSLRGTSNDYEIGKSGATALLSTSALISPGSDCDD